METMSTTPDRGSSVPARAEQASRSAAFRRYLRLTLLGAALPGSAFIASGRRRLGTVVLAVSIALVLAVLGALLVFGPKQLGVALVARPEAMHWLGIALLVLAVLWVIVMIASQRSLEPRSLTFGQRALGAGLVVVLCSVVAAPLAVGSQAAFTTQDLVSSVVPAISYDANGRDPGSMTTPTVRDVNDPWPGKSRINVLLIGGDWSNARAGLGVRTDSMIVASIDKATGQTVLFSLPRNLQHAPFPPGPFRMAYPDGFYNADNPDEGLLNEVYDTVPVQHPELFPKGTRKPGVEALKLTVGEILGLDVDYYVMVNLGGFREAINALGGVYLNVHFPIPIRSKTLPNGTCSAPEGYVQPGQDRLLTGDEALWFARARCGGGEMSDGDNDRMRRQRCVIGAIVNRLTPEQLLLRYQALAAEAKRVVSTDIPQQLLQPFVDLGGKVTQHPVKSLAFTGTTLKGTNARPDFERIRALVTKALAQPVVTKSPAPATTPSGLPAPAPKPKTSPTPKKGEESGTAESLAAVC